MTEHLPECPWFPNTHEDVTCRDAETLVTFCEVIAKVREETLNAAREAVAATFIGWCKDYMNCTDYEHVCGKRREIIAAIDALKEKR